MKYITISLFVSMLVSCSQSITKSQAMEENTNNSQSILAEVSTQEESGNRSSLDTITDFLKVTEAQWKEILTEEEFGVLRRKGTERSFTGEYTDFKKEGTFVCKGCNTDLFLSSTKFKSGTGWPSFYDEINNNVVEVADNSYGMRRTEIVCVTCNGHLGHVFNDGPNPTGLRYCVNSISLSFVPKK